MRVGLAQCRPALGDVAGNLDSCLSYLAGARDQECDLVVFPECALSGYMFDDRAAAQAAAVPASGEAVGALLAQCRRDGLHCVIGVLVSQDGQLRNSALLLGPGGLIGRYDKTHIPQLGADRFVTAGPGPYQVHQTAIGRIGMQICYDWRFPEVTRTLALLGADLVAMPTCSPVSSSELADYIPRTRAVENALFFAMANRVGTEGAASFFGRSQVIDPGGRALIDAGGSEGLVSADIDIGQARRKDREQGDGLYQLQIMQDRRPDLYLR
jgi:5-aminopentanamidase